MSDSKSQYVDSAFQTSMPSTSLSSQLQQSCLAHAVRHKCRPTPYRLISHHASVLDLIRGRLAKEPHRGLFERSTTNLFEYLNSRPLFFLPLAHCLHSQSHPPPDEPSPDLILKPGPEQSETSADIGADTEDYGGEFEGDIVEQAEFSGDDDSQGLGGSAASKDAQRVVTSARKRQPRENFVVKIPAVNVSGAIETMRLAREHGLTSEEVVLQPASRGLERQEVMRTLRRNEDILAAKMRIDLQESRQQSEMKAILQQRGKLPLMAKLTRQKLLRILSCNDVVIILAKTGSGKTTQVPQIILDDQIMSGNGPSTNIVCTQPRRFAATSVAHRVAYERRERLRNSVGFHIRDQNWSPNRLGSIVYCTTGILLNRLISDPQGTLKYHSHIIVDEVHERDIQIDLVLTLLRNAAREAKATGQNFPKIILMSATIDAGMFIDYFKEPTSEGTALRVACFEAEGSSAHVETYYLPDILSEISQAGSLHPTAQTLLQGKNPRISSASYIEREMQFSTHQANSASDFIRTDETSLPGMLSVQDTDSSSSDETAGQYTGLVAAVIAHIVKSKPQGDLLVFLPGKADIDTVWDLLTQVDPLGINFNNNQQFRLFKLHSQLRASNYGVYDPIPPSCRRIILATNIAETSVTLPDVKYVVDTGKARSSLWDPVTLKRSLPYRWISKTNSIQRRGRAGRVRNGHYYALFSKERYESFRTMGSPKIKMNDLVEFALQLKTQPQKIDLTRFLNDTIEPPSPQNVKRALKSLQTLGVLTKNEELTGLGQFLSRFGLHPALGKGILLGALFGCLEPMLILGCHGG
ncbi:uncharacterized protein Z518_08594 [Rhinocladiella mackenziei CBS 650.93]|uniref:Rhinocladiella mackenziei CBS 650.93 unplaced genomic scaffold supercont1.6, whole genome shotgun sequence n=1 Tax=Rhinocladiella mackenziei CBS 650.93 TaxID=1442369 RepID=A0A0D2FL18_9EURO|nr:uncharacterized protein Z518_08594 [Rhinocladiella mackenziei CBS 650.93]KIX02652.1 hypothetical protein Z518_08594 [Rhinocladiella mackenziei CBS 650.93]